MERKEYEFDQVQQRPMRRGPGGPGGRMGGGEKSKDLFGTWKKLIIYCRKYIVFIVIALVCAIGGTVQTLLGPDKLSEITEYIQAGLMSGNVDLDAIFKVGITLVYFYAASWLLSALQSWIMATVTQKVSKSMRRDISQKINSLPMWYYNRTTTGDVLSRVTNDVDTMGQSLNQSVGSLITQIVLFFDSLIMMLITNWIMALTAVVATFIGLVIMMLIMSRSQKYFTVQQCDLGALNGHVEEIYAGHTVVKAYNGEAQANAEFDRLNTSLRNSGFRAHCLSGLMMPLMTFIGNFAYVAVCIVGGSLAISGSIGIEVIVAFMLYVRYFTQPLSGIPGDAVSPVRSRRRRTCL